MEVGGERLHSYNVIWAAGVRAAPLVATLGAELGPGGRVKVQPDCSVPGHPNVFVIGDAAYLVDSKTGKPGAGRFAGRAADGPVRRAASSAKSWPATRAERRAARAQGFHYKDFGSMATVGKSRAVVEIGPLQVRRLPGVVCVAGAAHHGAHRLSQPHLRVRVLDLRLRVLPARLAADHALVRQIGKAVPAPLNSAAASPKQ